MVSCKMNPTIIEIDFYDYKIRMCTIGGTKMYLVSDLLRQYNEKHGTNKRFTHYLENKQTQELLQKQHEESVRENSPLLKIGAISAEDEENDTISVSRNSGLLKIGAISAEDEKWDIPHVIQYKTLPMSGGANKGYIICEELLHDCLMWADRVFAWKVYRFLTRLREQDNDYLRKENEYLKKRYIPNDQQWYYILSTISGKTKFICIQIIAAWIEWRM